MGFPEDIWGYPEDISDHPEENWDSPEDISGFPEENSDHPGEISGFPRGFSGHPEDFGGWVDGFGAGSEEVRNRSVEWRAWSQAGHFGDLLGFSGLLAGVALRWQWAVGLADGLVETPAGWLTGLGVGIPQICARRMLEAARFLFGVGGGEEDFRRRDAT